MAKTASLKTIALRTLKDSTTGAATRLVALRAAKPYLEATDYELRLRQLAETARGKVLRLLLLELTEINAASRADEVAKQKRAEVDRILADAARELALADPAPAKPPTIQEDPNAKPSVVADQAFEPRAVAPSVPENGVSCEAIADIDGRILDGPAPAIAVKQGPSREELLAEGHQSQATTLAQTSRCWRAPHNKQEAARLDALKAKWVTFEREALAEGIDVQKEFGDRLPWLRPFPIKVDLARLRRTLSVPELNMMLPEPIDYKKPEKDCDIWSGMPSGI